jgi:teichuronic acid biosynthesis glycosyltransferase TuaC
MFLFLSTVGHVSRLRREFDFDVIDAHFAFPDGFAAVLLGWWFGRPVVITARGTEITLSRFYLRRAAISWALRRATRVIAVADNLYARVREAGVDESRVTVVPNGVDVARFAPGSRDETRGRLGIRPDARLIVSVGHLSTRKGFHRIVAAMPRLIGEFPDLMLAIVGGPGAEGDARPVIAAAARQAGVESRVTLVGAVKPDRVAEWIAAADVFVLASSYEGCPNVVLEALACGRPVVATNVGHVASMISPEAGIVVPTHDDDALAAAIRTAFARQWDSAAIRRLAEQRTWEVVASQVAEEWRSAVAARIQRMHAVVRG